VSVQSRYVILNNRLVTPRALGREQAEIIIAAVRLSVFLVESGIAKRLLTLCTHEMFRMPCPVHRSDT